MLVVVWPWCVSGAEPDNKDAPRGYEDAATAAQPQEPDAAADELPEGLPEAPQEGDLRIEVDVAAPVPPEAVQPEPDAAMLEMEKQLRPQIVAMAKSELSFMRQICVPSEEEDARIIDAMKGPVRDATRQAAQAQAGPEGNGRERRMVVGHVNGRVVMAGDPIVSARQVIQQGLTEAVRQVMSEPMAERYQAELDDRQVFRKRALAKSLVASLDEMLELSVQQRAELTESLMANWNRDWEMVMNQFMQHNRGYVPQIPDNLIAPTLSDHQRKVWNRLQKIGGQQFGGFVENNWLDQFGAQFGGNADDDSEPDPFSEDGQG